MFGIMREILGVLRDIAGYEKQAMIQREVGIAQRRRIIQILEKRPPGPIVALGAVVEKPTKQ